MQMQMQMQVIYKTKQNKTKQNKTKQNKTKQNKQINTQVLIVLYNNKKSS
jgi:hypothetical protein